MTMRTTLLLFSGAIGICLAGCASSSPIMRGQSFDGGYGMTGECQSCDSGYGAQCQECEVDVSDMKRRQLRKMGLNKTRRADCRGCQGVGCDQCLNVPFHPVHRNFHTYDAPSGLSYPSEQAPTAAVQYPYYTFRGPTDFFMK